MASNVTCSSKIWRIHTIKCTGWPLLLEPPEILQEFPKTPGFLHESDN